MESQPASHETRQTPPDRVDVAVTVLRGGGVVSVPTDTLYGLAASALDASAVERVFEIKRRPREMAIPVLLADAEDLDRYAAEIPAPARRLAERFFPGPLTLVLQSSGIVPRVVAAGLDTVALRVPDHPVPRAIVRELGAPITGTSANRSGMPGLTTAEEVRARLGDEVDYVVDGGRCPIGEPSTVVGFSGGRPIVLRAGAVSVRRIEDACRMSVAVRDDA